MRNIDLQERYRAALPSVDKDPLARLPKSHYHFVWKVSGPQQALTDQRRSGGSSSGAGGLGVDGGSDTGGS